MRSVTACFKHLHSLRLQLVAIAIGVPLLLSGCETLTEPMLIERVDFYDSEGVHIFADLEDAMMAGRYWTFTAYNMRSEPICVTSVLKISHSQGHSVRERFVLQSGEMIDYGWINEPASWRMTEGKWYSAPNGRCD